MPLRAHTPAWPSTETTEQRAVAALRLVLATAALAVVWIDPVQSNRLAGPLWTALCAYTAYSAGLYLYWLRASARRAGPWAHWIDVGWYLLLTGLSGGVSSLFFSYFFFPILVASFRAGFAAGMATTFASALGITAVGVLVSREAGLALNRLLLRPIALLVIGFAISSRGGFSRRSCAATRGASRSSRASRSRSTSTPPPGSTATTAWRRRCST